MIERFNDRDYGLSVVGKGWAELVGRAYDEFDRLRAEGQTVYVLQVKEKFGALRIYVSDRDPDGLPCASEELAQFLWRLEEESQTVCEDCGKPGDTQSNGRHVKTVCEEHKRPGDKRWAYGEVWTINDPSFTPRGKTSE